MLFRSYKNEIKKAREFRDIGLLIMLVENARADYYNEKLSLLEYEEIKRMVFGL